jgi:UDP-2,3-diacylglucosamine pyrophosphatase LpxH
MVNAHLILDPLVHRVFVLLNSPHFYSGVHHGPGVGEGEVSMRTIKLIVSDLHVASGDTMLDGFGERQQAALEGLLAAAGRSGGSPLGEGDDVELIINGDCFDFVAVEPHDTGGVMDTALALEKLGKMTAAHGPFFETLHRFVRQPRRRITFMTGNHDIELCFAGVRAGIMEAMGMQQDDWRVYFCPMRSYRPLPDVYIEHGNAYDFWNHDRSGFWDASGHVRTANPQVMTLPMDSQYMQHVGHPVLARYPYLTLFEPSLSIPRQVALFCLLNPAVVVELIQHVQELLDAGTHEPRKGLLHLAPGEESSPAALFEQAIMVLVAFQQEAATRSPGWKEPSGEEAALQAQAQAMMEVAMVRETLSRVGEDECVTEAIATICTPTTAAMGDSVAAGMHTMLNSDPSLRYAIAGHTHKACIDRIKGGTAEQQVYLNTGGWTSWLALPASEEVTPELVAWLREPDWGNIPLRDIPPQCVFALVNAAEGPSSASLCIWEGGSNGQYRVLT